VWGHTRAMASVITNGSEGRRIRVAAQRALYKQRVLPGSNCRNDYVRTRLLAWDCLVSNCEDS